MSEAIDGPMFGTAVGAGEQGILAGQGKGTDGALDDVVVDLDAAVVEEQAQALPARQRVADRLGELGLLADELELGAQPRLEVFDQRPAALLADHATLLGGTAADLALDPVELGDARQRLGWRSAPGQAWPARRTCRRTWLQQKASRTSLCLASTL